MAAPHNDKVEFKNQFPPLAVHAKRTYRELRLLKVIFPLLKNSKKP
jgi:hypothetical protein